MFKRDDLLTILNLNKTQRYFASNHLTLLNALDITGDITHPDKLIFLHIPKTGGTNIYFMYEAIEKQYGKLSSVRLSVPYNPGVCSPNKISEGWVGAYNIGREVLKNMSTNDFISGHFPFGLHSHLECEEKSVKYIALCRDPLQRTLSTVNFDYQRGNFEKKNVLKYLKNSEIDNPQTRILAGVKHMTGPCTEATLKLAKQNIEQHFLFIAPTEETNVVIQILATLQGVIPLALARAQVTGEKVIGEIDESLKTWLLDKHCYDTQLYQWVKERWLKWKTDNIAAHNAISDEEEILTIPADYAHKRQPLLLTHSELIQLNKAQKEDTLEMYQKNNTHHEVSTELQSSVINTPMFRTTT